MLEYEEVLEFSKKEEDFTDDDWFWKGIADYEEGNLINAKDFINKAIKLDKYNTYYLTWLSKINVELENYDEAIINCNEVIKINPEYANAYNNRGMAKFRQNKFNEAEKDISMAIKLNPKEVGNINNLGDVYIIQKEYIKATLQYQKVLKLDKENFKALNDLGFIKNEQTKYLEGLKYLNKAIKVSKIESPNPYGHRAYSHIMLGNLNEAKKDNKKALKLEPLHKRAHYNKGLIAQIEGKNNKACKAWKKALDLGFKDAQKKLKEFCEN